jgi:transposase
MGYARYGISSADPRNGLIMREVEKLTGQGMTIPMAAKKVGSTDQTLYRWRILYGAPKEAASKGGLNQAPIRL